jgi:hypothetical protein
VVFFGDEVWTVGLVVGMDELGGVEGMSLKGMVRVDCVSLALGF